MGIWEDAYGNKFRRTMTKDSRVLPAWGLQFRTFSEKPFAEANADTVVSRAISVV